MRTTYIFLCYISQQPLVQIRPDFLCRLYLKHLSKCAQILIADSLPIIYDVFVALRAYHLTCHSDKFRSSSSFFLPEFVISTSISFHYSIIMKICMIINIYMKFPLETFHQNQSCMTSCRRHFVFLTLSHVIDHILVTKCHFQN